MLGRIFSIAPESLFFLGRGQSPGWRLEVVGGHRLAAAFWPFLYFKILKKKKIQYKAKSKSGKAMSPYHTQQPTSYVYREKNIFQTIETKNESLTAFEKCAILLPMQDQSEYHTQAVDKICRFCGKPFHGHPTRLYCTVRCKRRAKEHRWTMSYIDSVQSIKTAHTRYYSTANKIEAEGIFDFVKNSPTPETPLVRTFTEPDSTIVPAEIGLTADAAGGYYIAILPPDMRSLAPRSVTIAMREDEI